MASSRQNQARAPTLEDIEQQYSQLPPQYRQAVFEKKQREYQQGLLQQPPSRSEPVRNTSVSLSSSPTRPSEGGPGPGTLTRAASSAWSATRQRIVSAPLSTYRKDHDSDSSSITSNITGPGRAHWKPDNSTNVCTWPGCKVEFGLFDRRHHCRKCGDIFCNTHCSKEVPLDYTLDFNPAEGVMSRACVGCHEAYGQWHVHPPSNRNHRAEGLKRNISNPNTSTTTKSPPSAGSASSSSTLGRKLNTGRIPDGFLGGDLTIEGIGREDIVRQPGSVNIAIKKQPSSDQTVMPMASVPHDWSWSTF
ncbi:hypothetical protein B0O80DRAFT_65015 [Mortierella sp. GBAus27b]|nr:hypothetical protein B0O80DRAFT_65015 [Mortierella sp. GBAus27b]